MAQADVLIAPEIAASRSRRSGNPMSQEGQILPRGPAALREALRLTVAASALSVLVISFHAATAKRPLLA